MVGDLGSVFRCDLLAMWKLYPPKPGLALFLRIEKITKYPTSDLAMVIWQCIRYGNRLYCKNQQTFSWIYDNQLKNWCKVLNFGVREKLFLTQLQFKICKSSAKKWEFLLWNDFQNHTKINLKSFNMLQ